MRFDTKGFFKTVLLNLVFVLIICYVLFQYFRNMGATIETDRVTLIERQDNIETNGYIFRNEDVIFAGNKVNYLIDNGEKVSKNQAIAQLNVNSYDLSLRTRIDELDKKIAILERSNINLTYVKTTPEKLEKDSHELYLGMIHSIQDGKIKSVAESRDELLITLNKKQLMTQEITAAEFERLISLCKTERDQLQSQIAASSASGSYIYSDLSGIFYSSADGYENFFTADALKDLNLEKLRELIAKEPDNSIVDNAMGKIANNYEWYLVCIVPRKEGVEYNEEEKYSIIYPFSSNKSVESVLTKKIESVNSDEVMLVFRTMRMPEGFDFSRKQTIRLVFNELNGIKIPEEAVRVVTDEDGTEKQGVYVLNGNVVMFKELPENEYIDKYDGYYVYLEPSERTLENTGTLQLHEEIVTAGKDIYDGKTLN